jgi:hypothetical protein
MPNKPPEPTAVGAGRSAVAVHVACRQWPSFLHRPWCTDHALVQLHAALAAAPSPAAGHQLKTVIS